MKIVSGIRPMTSGFDKNSSVQLPWAATIRLLLILAEWVADPRKSRTVQRDYRVLRKVPGLVHVLVVGGLLLFRLKSGSEGGI